MEKGKKKCLEEVNSFGIYQERIHQMTKVNLYHFTMVHLKYRIKVVNQNPRSSIPDFNSLGFDGQNYK